MPLCSPNRATLLTGQFPSRHGIIDNVARSLASHKLETFPRALQTAGYRTAFLGKWHMGTQRERPGFDYVASFVGQGGYVDCPIILNGRRTETHGWIDDVSTDYAIEFLTKQGADQPFFLFLGFKSPHGPRGGRNLPERAAQLYEGMESRPVPNLGLRAAYQPDASARAGGGRRRDARRLEGHSIYMRHITAIDDCVGRVLDALDETGQAENTIVLIASDNGYYLGEHGLGDKRTAYEESLRVPLMIRLPAKTARRGEVCDALALNIDYAPTLLDFAGAPAIPDVHGRSLRPLLEGRPPADWRTAFFYEYFKERNFAPPTVLSVRTATRKLITYPGHEEWTEAYDVANDPYETKNLASDASLVEELQREFDQQADAVGFRMPEGVGAADEPAVKRGSRKRGAVRRPLAASPPR